MSEPRRPAAPAARASRAALRLLFPLLLLYPLTALGAPSALRVPPGARVATPDEALAPPWVPLNALSVDLDDDGRPEEAVLFGAARAGRVARVAGLLLLRRVRRGLQVQDAVRFPSGPFESVSLTTDARDLDRDGRHEIVVVARLEDAGITRTVRGWWAWAGPARRRLVRLHRAETHYRDLDLAPERAASEVTRRVEPVAPDEAPHAPRVVEHVRVLRRAEGEVRESHHVVRYRLDRALGRFVAEENRRDEAETPATEEKR